MSFEAIKLIVNKNTVGTVYFKSFLCGFLGSLLGSLLGTLVAIIIYTQFVLKKGQSNFLGQFKISKSIFYLVFGIILGNIIFFFLGILLWGIIGD